MTYSFPKLPRQYAWLEQLDYRPKHLVEALNLYGTTEMAGTADNPVIMGWRDECKAAGVNVAGYTADSVPWCGLFQAVVMVRAGRDPAPDPLWALNWAKFGVDGGQPELGDILTFKRPGGGHVAQYIAEDKMGCYHVLGANQHDQVNIMRIQKDRMYSCRQPPYNNKPVQVRPYIVSPDGVVSKNEA